MRGTIQARGKNTWRLRVDAGTDPATGRRKIVSKTVHCTKREAQDELAKLVVKNSGRRPDSDARLTTVVGAWLDGIEAAATSGGRSLLTWQRYEQAARLHLLPALGDYELRRIGAFDLDNLYLTMARDGHKPASIRKVHQVASGALGQAVKWGWLHENPAASASPPPIPKSEVRPPKPATIKAVWSKIAADDPEFALFVHLAAVTGCRRGELCALRWEHLDVDSATLHVSRGVISVRGGRTLEKQTKTETSRRFKLPATTMTNLAAHRIRMAERMLAGGLKVEPSSYLFPAERDARNRRTFAADRPTRPDVMTHRWARLRESVPDARTVRLHDLRHHAATQLIAGGVDLRTVMARLGWTTLSTALRYIHLVDETDAAAAEVMERVLNG